MKQAHFLTQLFEAQGLLCDAAALQNLPLCGSTVQNLSSLCRREIGLSVDQNLNCMEDEVDGKKTTGPYWPK
jgi:hypothetical protein